jgi:hypothetical protein
MKRKYHAISVSSSSENESEEEKESAILDEDDDEISSMFDYLTTNSSPAVVFRHVICCKEKETQPVDTSKLAIINFDDNNYIHTYFSTLDKNIDFRDYDDFDESRCFFCNWFSLIKKELKKGILEDVVYNTYPNIGDDAYSTLMSYIDECKDDFTMVYKAYNYYVAKIKTPMNNNTMTDKHSKKRLFPDITHYAIHLHATHNRQLNDKLYNEANSLMDLSKYIKKNMGLIKKDKGTGEMLFDKDMFKIIKDSADTSVKIFSALKLKNINANINNINITNNKKKK